MSKSLEILTDRKPVHQSNESTKVDNEQPIEAELPVAELVGKHPLNNKWTFWIYHKKSKVRAENLQKVASFDTVEDFWYLFNDMRHPSQLKQSDYCCFKNGIIPLFGDGINNIAGGRWFLRLPSKINKQFVDDYWKNIILSITHEIYDQSSEITGASVAIRSKGTTLAVWTNNGSKDNGNNIMAIGRKIKEVSGVENHKMHYETFADIANKKGSFKKVRTTGLTNQTLSQVAK